MEKVGPEASVRDELGGMARVLLPACSTLCAQHFKTPGLCVPKLLCTLEDRSVSAPCTVPLAVLPALVQPTLPPFSQKANQPPPLPTLLVRAPLWLLALLG